MESKYLFIILFFRNIARIVSNLMNAYCFLQLFDGLVVSPPVRIQSRADLFAV